MLEHARRLSLFALLPWLAACAASSSTPAAPRAVERGVGPGLPQTSLLCHPGATTVAFDQLHLPPDSFPVDVALTPEHVWVLFRPGRLVRVTRTPGQVKVASRSAAPGEVWTAMDVDGEEGSVWIVAQDFGLRRFGTDLAPREAVPLGREVIGEGGIVRVLAAGGILLAQPSCGEYGVWRIAADGKVLGTDFRAPQESDVIDPATMSCARVALMRDAEDGVVAWDADQGKAHRAGPDGTWTEIDPDPYRLMEVCNPPRSAGAPQVWTPIDFCDEMIHWQDRLLLLHVIPGSAGLTSRLIAVDGGQVHQYLETCFGDAIQNVAVDGVGYAAITRRGVAFGGFADAPGLPSGT